MFISEITLVVTSVTVFLVFLITMLVEFKLHVTVKCDDVVWLLVEKYETEHITLFRRYKYIMTFRSEKGYLRKIFVYIIEIAFIPYKNSVTVEGRYRHMYPGAY